MVENFGGKAGRKTGVLLGWLTVLSLLVPSSSAQVVFVSVSATPWDFVSASCTGQATQVPETVTTKQAKRFLGIKYGERDVVTVVGFHWDYEVTCAGEFRSDVSCNGALLRACGVEMKYGQELADDCPISPSTCQISEQWISPTRPGDQCNYISGGCDFVWASRKTILEQSVKGAQGLPCTAHLEVDTSSPQTVRVYNRQQHVNTLGVLDVFDNIDPADPQDFVDAEIAWNVSIDCAGVLGTGDAVGDTVLNYLLYNLGQ